MRHAHLSRIGAAVGIASLLALATAGPAAAEAPADEPAVEDPIVAHPDPDQPVSDDGLEYTTQVVDDNGSEVVDPTAELGAPVPEEQMSITSDGASGSTSRAPLAAAGALVLLAGAGGTFAVRRRGSVRPA